MQRRIAKAGHIRIVASCDGPSIEPIPHAARQNPYVLACIGCAARGLTRSDGQSGTIRTNASQTGRRNRSKFTNEVYLQAAEKKKVRFRGSPYAGAEHSNRPGLGWEAMFKASATGSPSVSSSTRPLCGVHGSSASRSRFAGKIFERPLKGHGDPTACAAAQPAFKPSKRSLGRFRSRRWVVDWKRIFRGARGSWVSGCR